MAEIEVHDVAHRYHDGADPDAGWALDGLSCRIDDGAAVAVLGPSGCGKTTLLGIVSGLLQPTRGRVTIGGREVTTLPPQERQIAQVFQFPVVYESMTVEENLAFPLRNRGTSEPERRRRVAEIADLLGLVPLLRHRARGLSVDEQQTVSLARGLVRPDLAALLLDEPLTVIDPARRWEIRQKLKKVHAESAVSLVYVTHDQTEALTFADRVIVMDAGRILQVGSPRDLFEDPAHRFVGHFIGSPGMNFLPCRVEGHDAVVGTHRIPLGVARPPDASVEGGWELGIRPEYLALGAQARRDTLPARVDSVAELGDHRIVTLSLGASGDADAPRVTVRAPDGVPVPERDAHLLFPPERIRLYRDGRLVA